MNQSKRVLFCLLLLLLFSSGCDLSRRTNALPATGSLYLASWFATYDSQRGLTSFANNIKMFNEINPVWYNLDPDYFSAGQTPLLDNSGDKSALLNLAQNNGVKVLPTIQNFGVSNFDPAVIHQIINNTTLRAKHVSDIVALVSSQAFDGIDIDYENLAASDQTAFATFIAELGQALAGRGKLLSVTVYAKTSGTESWNGPGAQDWSSLVRYADTIKVMVYDYHWVSYHAGPISPVDWLTAVLAYARTVPGLAGKLIVGLPFYGIDWPVGANGREVMYEGAMNIINQGITSSFSRDNVDHSAGPYCGTYFHNVEPHFTYSQNGVSHTVYFQDAAALQERLKIVTQYRDIVKGITFWHLGGEDPAGWNVISQFNYK